jgi:hypothetical protein
MKMRCGNVQVRAQKILRRMTNDFPNDSQT